MFFYRAALPLSSKTLTFVAGIIPAAIESRSGRAGGSWTPASRPCAISAAASTASNTSVNCPARSLIRNRNPAARSQVHQQVPGRVTSPRCCQLDVYCRRRNRRSATYSPFEPHMQHGTQQPHNCDTSVTGSVHGSVEWPKIWVETLS